MPAPRRLRSYTSSQGVSASEQKNAFADALRPSGAIAETVPRYGYFNTAIAMTSGTSWLVAIGLPVNRVITSISFLTGGTAINGPTAQWFALCDNNRNMLQVTSDDTNTAWAGNTIKALNLASTFTTTYSGLHYLALVVTDTVTPPDLRCLGQPTIVSSTPPILSGASTAALTTPASCPATFGAISASGSIPYAFVS